MSDSDKIDEILYLLKLREWRESEPKMTAMCSIKFGSPQHEMEKRWYKEWYESKPVLERVPIYGGSGGQGWQ